MADEDQGLSASPKSRDQKYGWTGCDLCARWATASGSDCIRPNEQVDADTYQPVCMLRASSFVDCKDVEARPDEGLVGGED